MQRATAAVVVWTHTCDKNGVHVRHGTSGGDVGSQEGYVANLVACKPAQLTQQEGGEGQQGAQLVAG